MAKDYAPRRNTEAKPSRVPRWVWIFSTTVIITFVSALVYLSNVKVEPIDHDSVNLKSQKNDQILNDVKNSIKDAIKESDVEAITKKIEEIKEIKEETEQVKDAFDFYKTLKDQEVVVPEAKPLDIKAINAAKKQYVLQAASFKNIDDANKLRAEFILGGLPETTIESSNGWHRVQVGPYASEIKISRAKAVITNQFNLTPLKKCAINCK
ncbi:SPOR domain-containing protein [Marinicellulosiphila megalodicopiae]|uniref:SPOR domain-containing protein n=1 Tax=Marinicellulosiphila megalodicopiae TaxID=2724896 RepID=UPI003BAF7C86